MVMFIHSIQWSSTQWVPSRPGNCGDAERTRGGGACKQLVQNGVSNAKLWFSLGICSGHFPEYHEILLAYTVVLNRHRFLTAIGIPPALWPLA